MPTRFAMSTAGPVVPNPVRRSRRAVALQSADCMAQSLLPNCSGRVKTARTIGEVTSSGYPPDRRRVEGGADVTQQAVGYEDFDVSLESGRLRVRRWGATDSPVVVCVPGLSANLCGFDRLADQLAGDTLQLVAIDLRGRGRSEVTGAGTYGWRNHARDVLGIADA